MLLLDLFIIAVLCKIHIMMNHPKPSKEYMDELHIISQQRLEELRQYVNKRIESAENKHKKII